MGKNTNIQYGVDPPPKKYILRSSTKGGFPRYSDHEPKLVSRATSAHMPIIYTGFLDLPAETRHHPPLQECSKLSASPHTHYFFTTHHNSVYNPFQHRTMFMLQKLNHTLATHFPNALPLLKQPVLNIDSPGAVYRSQRNTQHKQRRSKLLDSTYRNDSTSTREHPTSFNYRQRFSWPGAPTRAETALPSRCHCAALASNGPGYRTPAHSS